MSSFEGPDNQAPLFPEIPTETNLNLDNYVIPEYSHSLRAKLIAGGVAGGLIVGVLVPLTSHESAPEPKPKTTTSAPVPEKAHVLPLNNQYTCPPIDANSTKLVTKIVNTPSTLVYSFPDKHVATGDSIESYSGFTYAESTYYTHAEVAKRVGEVTYDPARFLKPLMEDLAPVPNANGRTMLPPNPQLPLQTYINNTSDYLAEFGIKVDKSIGHIPSDLLSEAQKSAVDIPSNTNKLQVMHDLVHIIKAYSSFTQGFIDLSRDKQIVLADETLNTAGMNTVTNTANTIYYNLGVDFTNALGYDNVPYSEGDIETHEEFHGIFGAVCGGGAAMNNAPAFSKFNQGQPYSTNYSTLPSANYYQYMSILNRSSLRLDAMNDYRKDIFAPACVDTKAYIKFEHEQGAATDFVEPYAEEDEAEDEAETMMPATNINNIYNRLDPNTPNLRNKFIQGLSEVMYYDPPLGNYLALLNGIKTRPLDQILLENCKQFASQRKMK